MEGVYEVKDITIIWQSNEARTLDIYTDMPSGWGVVRSITLPSTSNVRTQKTFNLDSPAPVQGTMWKPRVYGGSIGYCALFHPSFIRKRRYGVYLLGANGDVWETQPLDLGA